MKKFRVGVIGVGFIGAVHIEQLRRLGNVDVVALTNLVESQKLADKFYVPKGYDNYKSMIDNENLDAIHICTPNNTHYEIAMYAMEKGVHVICEKPMTTTAKEADELLQKAKEKNLVHAMNFNCRFYPMAYQMKEMIKSNDCGRIYTIHGGYLQDWLFYDTDYNWRLEPSEAGESRAFADIGSHWIDLVEFVTGLSVVEVFADAATFHNTRKKPKQNIATYSGMALRPEDYDEVKIETEDYISVLFRMNNGTRASCNISQVFAGRKNQMLLSIAGSKCSLSWDSENSNELWIGRRDRDNGVLVKDPSILPEATRQTISYPGGHVEGFPDTFKQNFKKIYQAIELGSMDNVEFASFSSGAREMLLCEKIIQSAKEGRWVKVDELV
mgnify:CR=1 FL=1